MSKTMEERLEEIFEEIRGMEITPFGAILDFLIEQGLTLEQVQSWYRNKGV